MYLCRQKGSDTVEALSTTCPHAGCFVEIDTAEKCFRCPCHNRRFTTDGGITLTGHLLPWDQQGSWATRVATNLAGLVPLVGPSLKRLVGGPDYGHHTLTRCYGLHAGFLPRTLIIMLVVHLSLFRKHGLHMQRPIGCFTKQVWLLPQRCSI